MPKEESTLSLEPANPRADLVAPDESSGRVARFLRGAGPAFWLWLSLFLPGATIHHAEAGWNVNTRLDLVFALVDQRSIRIDDYQDLPPYDTGDKAFFGGHYYSDKVFGLSLLGVAPYAVLRGVFAGFGAEPGYPLAHWWIRIWSVGALAAGAGVLLWRFFCRLGVAPRAAFWLTQGAFYGTLCFPYGTIFYPYLPGVFFCLLAWDRLCGGREGPRGESARDYGTEANGSRGPDEAARSNEATLSKEFPPSATSIPSTSSIKSVGLRSGIAPVGPFLVGLFLGLALIMDYIFGLVVAALAARALWVWRGKGWIQKTLSAALGGAIPLAAFAAYLLSIFGSLSIPYQYEADPLFRIGMSQGFMGVTGFQPATLYYLTIHPYRGLFFWSPVLLVAAVGAARMIVGMGGMGEMGGMSGMSGLDKRGETGETGETGKAGETGGNDERAVEEAVSSSAESALPRGGPALRRWEPALPSGSAPDWRFAGWLALGLGAAYLVFNASYYMWWGGWAMGPRLLIPAIPFLALGLAGVWRWGRAGRAIVAISAIASVAMILPPSLVDPQTPMWFHKWPELLHPTISQDLKPEQFLQMQLFLQGRVGVALGGLLGLPGLWALLPTAIGWMVPVGLYFRSYRDDPKSGGEGKREETA